MTSPPLDHHAPQTMRERLAAWIGPAFAVVAFLAAAWLLHRELKDHSWAEILAAVSALPRSRVILALILTALNYAILSGYDGLAVWYLRHPLRWSKVMLGAFIGYAMSHNFTWMLGGTATRFRLYSSWGFSTVKLIKLFALLGLAFWTGYCTVAGFVFLTHPMQLPERLRKLHIPLESTFWLGPILLGVLGLYLIGCAFGKPIVIRRWRIEFPPLRLALMHAVVASCDLLLQATIMYVLMPTGLGIDFWETANVVLLAGALAIVSHVPGGIGVLEAAVLELLPQDNPAAIFGSLLAFRVIFYLLPLLVAVLSLGWHELSTHAKKRA
jgi:phosphatidylglycerol lysyltransferase